MLQEAQQLGGQLADNQPIDEIQQAPWETSDDPLVLRARIRELEDLNNVQQWSGEAPGLAWMELWTEKGARITVSSRAITPTEAIHGLVSAVKAGRDLYKLSSVKPQQAAPQPQPQAYSAPAPVGGEPPVVMRPPATNGAPAPAGGHGTVMDIRAVAAKKTKAGEVYLQVKCGKYSQHGIPAYDRIFDTPQLQQIYAQIQQWPQGQDYALPPSWGITKALVDESGQHPRVIGFQ